MVAFEHAKNALIYVQDEILYLSQREADPVKYMDKVTYNYFLTFQVKLLAIAYYNMGVESEHQNHLGDCITWYKKSLDVFTEYKLEDEILMSKFTKAYNIAKQKFNDYMLRAAEPKSLKTSTRSPSPLTLSPKKESPPRLRARAQTPSREHPPLDPPIYQAKTLVPRFSTTANRIYQVPRQAMSMRISPQ